MSVERETESLSQFAKLAQGGGSSSVIAATNMKRNLEAFDLAAQNPVGVYVSADQNTGYRGLHSIMCGGE